MENQQAVAAGILRDCCLSSTSVVGLCERGFSLGPTCLGQPVQTNPLGIGIKLNAGNRKLLV